MSKMSGDESEVVFDQPEKKRLERWSRTAQYQTDAKRRDGGRLRSLTMGPDQEQRNSTGRSISDERSVGVNPIGDVRIEYIGDAFSQGQSTDAAPLTELIDFYTFPQTYSVLQDLLRFGLSVLRLGITLVVKNLHDVVVIFQCVRQWMVRR